MSTQKARTTAKKRQARGSRMLALTEADERSVTINIRAPRQTRDLIDRAAEIKGKNRSEFMLESARQAAQDVLLDQRHFLLDDEQHRRFLEALEAPVKPNAALKALLSKRAPWEK